MAKGNRGPDPRSDDVRAVLTRSRNRCAFPGCNDTLIEGEKLFVGILCHIEAASPKGPRFNTSMTHDERRGHANLMFLCHRHHVVIDSDRAAWDVPRLLKMKADHENRTDLPGFVPSPEVIALIEERERSFVDRLEEAQASHPIPNLRIDVDPTRDPLAMIEDARAIKLRLSNIFSRLLSSMQSLHGEVVERLKVLGYDTRRWEDQHYGVDPTQNREWETIVIGLGNAPSELGVWINGLEFAILRDRLKRDPQNEELLMAYAQAEQRVLEDSENSAYID